MANNGENQQNLTLEQFKLRLTIWRDAIPIYEGGTRLLSHFIQTCDKFVENVATADNAINEALFALIKSKIRGEALDLIVANNPATYAACKTLLVNRFSDPSSEELLFNRLSVCYQLSNQSYEKYADEIKSRLNRLKEHIQLNNQDVNTINIKNTFYENVAKNTFINGIKEPYHSYLLHFDLDDIEACIIKCRKYDNHEQQSAFLNFARQRENKPKPNVFNTVNAKNTNPFATNSNPKIIHPSNNLPSTSRNANLFYLQPTPAFAQTQTGFIPTNRNNNFGQNNNNLPRQQNHQPTPMSVSTRNTNKQGINPTNRSNNLQAQNNFRPRTNFFRSTGPANFIAEELHHQQEQGEEETIDYQNDSPIPDHDEFNQENDESDNCQNFQQAPDTTETT